MNQGGPGCLRGLILLALAAAPALLFSQQPWQSIAVVNLAAHFLLGFSWTMAGTYRSEGIKQLGIFLWFLTIPLSVILLFLAILGVGS